MVRLTRRLHRVFINHSEFGIYNTHAPCAESTAIISEIDQYSYGGSVGPTLLQETWHEVRSSISELKPHGKTKGFLQLQPPESGPYSPCQAAIPKA